MEGSRALCSSSVPPESIVGEAWCQPCAINHLLSEEGRQGGDPPPRTGGWKFSCPPRLLKPRAPTDRTPTAGLAIRDRPRPEGPRTPATAASPLPPTPQRHSSIKSVLEQQFIVIPSHSFTEMATLHIIINSFPLSTVYSVNVCKKSVYVVFCGTWFYKSYSFREASFIFACALD